MAFEMRPDSHEAEPWEGLRVGHSEFSKVHCLKVEKSNMKRRSVVDGKSG